MRWHLKLAPLLAAATSLAAVGCGLQGRPLTTAISLVVTAQFGSKALPPPAHPAGAEATTALSLLEANYPVSLEGSGAVRAIGPISARGREGWTLFIDGVATAKNPALVAVHQGEAFWWDLHPHLPAVVKGVVGSFPQPFLSGIEGKRYPVRVECAAVTSPACKVVLDRLESLGVPAGLSGLSAAGETPDTLRIAVGKWEKVRQLVAAAPLEAGPGKSGVFAILSGAGRLLLALSPSGAIARSFGPGAGLIATVTYPTEAPLWLVTGTDEAGVLAAADQLDESSLRDHYAVAVSPAGEVVPLPVVG